MQRLIYMIDQLSKSVGHAFAWCIIILTLGTCYEVMMRYLFNDPTSWAFDLSYLMYGAVFYMAGAYALSRGGHVRADMFYRKWRPRTQAIVELVGELRAHVRPRVPAVHAEAVVPELAHQLHPQPGGLAPADARARR